MVDPYDWVDVPADQRPPTHYQLLGLPPTVADAGAIREAAARQLRKVVPYHNGRQAVSAKRLQKELNEARDTLLDPDRRSEYDALLPDVELVPDVTLDLADVPDVVLAPEPRPAGGPADWWQDAPLDKPAAPAQPWWTEAEPAPAAGPPPPPRTHIAEKEVALEHPTAARRSPVAAIALVMAVVFSLLGVGGYFAFIKKDSPPADPPPFAGLPKGTGQPPPKVVPPAPKEGPLALDLPAAPSSDFFDQLQAKVLRGHEGAVVGVAVARNGSRVISVGTDRVLRIWSMRQQIGVVRHPLGSEGVSAAYFDGDRRIAAADGLTVALMDANKTSAPDRQLESPRGGVTSVAVTADGGHALTGTTDSALRWWDTATGKFDEWMVAEKGRIAAVALSPDGTTALAALADGPVSLWNLSDRTKTWEWPAPVGGATAVQFSPDGRRAAAAALNGTVGIFDIASRTETARLVGHTGPVTAIGWLSDSRRLVSVSADATARLWNADYGQFLCWSSPLEGKGMAVAVDSADRFIAVGTGAGGVHVLPLPRAKPEAVAGAMVAPPADPLPVPKAADVAGASAKVRRELAADYARPTPTDALTLADTLFRRSAAANIPPAARFALLNETRDLALKADDIEMAFRAIESLAAWFEGDELADKATALAAAGGADPRAVVTVALRLGERAEAEERPEILEAVMKAMAGPAKTKLPESLAQRLAATRQRFDIVAAEGQKVREALVTMKKTPADPPANEVYGRFLCLTRQDWDAGLPFLARGRDPNLRDAAKPDRAAPTDPKAQLRVGETWYSLGVREKDQRVKQAMFGRALIWYDKAAKGNLDINEKVTATQRKTDIAKASAALKDPAALPLRTPAVIRHRYNILRPAVAAAEWKLDGDGRFQGDGVVLLAGMPTLTTAFGLLDGSRLTFAIVTDGRDLKITCGGAVFPIGGGGPTLRIVVERQGGSITVTSVGETGEPQVKTATLDTPGPAAIALRLVGTPARPDGTLITAALADGPIRIAANKPE